MSMLVNSEQMCHDAAMKVETPFGTHCADASQVAFDGQRYRFQFDNGFGASVICHQFSYGGPEGLWELAVTHRGKLDYDTAITNDVLGYLTAEDVAETLDRIAALDERIDNGQRLQA